MSKELEILFQNAIDIVVFSVMEKFADFWLRNADVSRNQGICHVIHIFFGSSLGKV